MAHQELALIALMKGVDKIPDKIWDMIPGHKVKKEEVKQDLKHEKEQVESRHQRRRDSESSKSRSSRDLDRSDTQDHHRDERRRRAKTESPYSSDMDDDREYRRDRSRRQSEYSSTGPHLRRSADYGYMNGVAVPAGMAYPLYHPATYPSAPYGPAVPMAYAAIPPINTQVPVAHNYSSTYGPPHSAGSSRSGSQPPPIWSNEASRRSSVYSNNNYTPPNKASPEMNPYSQPPPPMYQTHPAYTNGGTVPSSAAIRYTPSVVSTAHGQIAPAQSNATQPGPQSQAFPPHYPPVPSQAPSTFPSRPPAGTASQATNRPATQRDSAAAPQQAPPTAYAATA